MLRSLTLIALLGISTFSFAQRVFWAEKVVDFTSELSPAEYSASQVLGKPNAMPQGGDSPNAWMPAKASRLEYITVSFAKPMRVRQIIISESYNPSALYELYLYDRGGNENLVHTFEPKPIELKGRILNVFIERTSYRVYSLKLVVDGRAVPGYNAIDAIGISDEREAVEITIPQPQNLNEHIVVEQLDEKVNSEYQESRPLIAPDGKTLYFSRSNHPGNVGGEKDVNDIWYSELDVASGQWREAVNIGSPLNNKGPNYISSITPDGNAMTVLLGNEYSGGNKMRPGVSISTKNSTGWGTPQRLNIINAQIETTDGNYFLTNNKQSMIMSVNRFDAFGGTDLYVTFMQRDGKWTEPLNLGNDINTAHMESSPYLAADNETLYFSSGGYSGHGGSDVYISRRLDDTWTNWTEPENLGPDINSEGDDVFFNIPPSGKYAYYAQSNDNDPGNIRRIELPIFFQPAPVASVSGKVYYENPGNPVQAKITYRLMPEDTEIGFVMSDSITGEYDILLPVGAAYDYMAESSGFRKVVNTINLAEETDFSEIEEDIIFVARATEAPVLADAAEQATVAKDAAPHQPEPFLFDQIVYFDFASEYVDVARYPFLREIALYLLENGDAMLSISGYTDNVGPDQYNVGLSERRAMAVKKYLVSQGVSEERIAAKGLGSSEPAATNETKEGRQKNRRTEFQLK